MKKLFAFALLLSFFACSKEPSESCETQHICKIKVYSYTTCDGGETFTNVRYITALDTMPTCDTSYYKSKMYKMWQASPDDEVEVKFNKQYPKNCDCSTPL